MQEGRRPGQLEGVVAEAEQAAGCPQNGIAESQEGGAAACADGVEQIKDSLLADVGSHGNVGSIQIGEAGANALGPGDDAADAGGNVVGALVAEHLQGHSRGHLAFEGWILRMLGPLAGEGGEKASHGGAKAGAGDIDFHRLTVEVRGGRVGLFCLPGLRIETWGTHFI